MAGKRQIQEINAGSMADIAFLLLIFFLVATTMNVDTGITRQLPPIPPDDMQVTEDMRVNERNLLPIFINTYDNILVAGRPTDITQLTDAVKQFVINPTNDENMPTKKNVDIEMPDGSTWTVPVSEAVVSLTSDRGTSYDIYIQVQNELTRAFSEMREDASMAKFNRSFVDLGDEERKAITDAVPQPISEAEPRNVGGN
ncbi:MAG: biopolymer transporter ExbD [Alistipes sp.]|jgi:biopolymer transport protein ExbD|nr:biopolymer transporter ExbD [Alistipes sp.]